MQTFVTVAFSVFANGQQTKSPSVNSSPHLACEYPPPPLPSKSGTVFFFMLGGGGGGGGGGEEVHARSEVALSSDSSHSDRVILG